MKTYKLIPIIISTMLLTASTGYSADTIVYQNDFEHGAGSAWSTSAIDVTPVGGRHFLGQFGTYETSILNGSPVQLSLQHLPTHNDIDFSFDLFIISSWDGNGDGENHAGPDIWMVKEGNNDTLIKTTFTTGEFIGYHQSYPDTYEGGYTWDSPGAEAHSNPPNTGATERTTLGFGYWNAVYHIDLSFTHTSDDLLLSFLTDGHGVQPVYDESWGLDNVMVTANTTGPAPVPDSALPMTLVGGLWGLGLYLQKRIVRTCSPVATWTASMSYDFCPSCTTTACRTNCDP